MAKIFTVKKGSRIVIETGKSRSEAAKPRGKQASQSKGIIKSGREPEYPARRKKPDKTGFRMFDLGRLKNGADISFLFQPDFDFVDFEYAIPIAASFLYPESFEARDEFLMEMVSGSNYDSVFYEIKQADGDFYELLWGNGEGETVLLNSESERWRTGGIGLNRDGYNIQLLYIAGGAQDYNNQFFNPIVLPQVKVTGSFDYDADEVSFSFGDNDKIFILPALATYYPTTGFGGTDERILGNDLRFSPRSYFIPDTTPIVNPVYSIANNFDSSNYANTYQAIEYHAALPNARAYKRTLSGGVTTWSEIEPDEILPDPPFQPTSETAPGNFKLEAMIGNGGAGIGTLLAIVKRVGNLFYIWQNEI